MRPADAEPCATKRSSARALLHGWPAPPAPLPAQSTPVHDQSGLQRPPAAGGLLRACTRAPRLHCISAFNATLRALSYTAIERQSRGDLPSVSSLSPALCSPTQRLTPFHQALVESASGAEMAAQGRCGLRLRNLLRCFARAASTSPAAGRRGGSRRLGRQPLPGATPSVSDASSRMRFGAGARPSGTSPTSATQLSLRLLLGGRGDGGTHP